MEFGWQDIVALGLVLAAAGYLARLALSAVTRKQASGCGSGCGHCSAQSAANRASPQEIVSITELPAKVSGQVPATSDFDLGFSPSGTATSR